MVETLQNRASSLNRGRESSVLSLFSFSLLRDIHLSRSDKQSYILAMVLANSWSLFGEKDMYNWVSAAKKWNCILRWRGRSASGAVYKVGKYGSKDTALRHATFEFARLWFFHRLRQIVCGLRYDRNQSRAVPQIENLESSLLSRISWLRVPKAAVKSSRKSITYI